MQYPLNMFVAIIISSMHLLISFKLKLPDKYKNKFRLYSVVVNLIFIVFLGSFSIFFIDSLPNQGIEIYFNGLATLYFGLFVPLGATLILLFRRLIIKADIYSIFAKYMLIIGNIVLITGTISVGYILFMLSFYGFAP